ncbi:hypothetical protein LTR05_002636 [Lithohypha guttulata]|uniref:Uncharacterized protein n=1 Tax=Lithohypha guttulata TaxID=1690604 RepID=A0AAN7T4H1_9EURO|nr:hypothetical protein LTR05_002636 [Lithohypha guttulata]
MASIQTVRLVGKARYDEQVCLQIPLPATSLGPSSVRVRTRLVGITANNLSYCLMGDVLHWWSAFPLPASLPEHYNDVTKYGIAPGWGCCEVLESTIEDIEPGRVISGFLPISEHTVDLQLTQVASVPGHFTETSPHRNKIMNLYQRYQLEPADTNLNNSLLAWSAVLKVNEAGASIARFLFPQDGSAPIHPLGDPTALGIPAAPWTTKEADLAGACIVCLGSGSKTARSFIHELAAIAATKQPGYTLIEVTSSKEGCRSYIRNVPFTHKVVNYHNLAGSFEPYQKYVVLNFAGRGNSLEEVVVAIKQVNSSAEVVCVAIGAEAKVYDQEAMSKRRATAEKLKPWQMNATGIRDAAMLRCGEAKYFEDMDSRFAGMVAQQEHDFDGRVLGLNLKVEHGLKGEDGIEGRLSGEDALVVTLND